jgi:hypothetical protein
MPSDWGRSANVSVLFKSKSMIGVRDKRLGSKTLTSRGCFKWGTCARL